MKHKLLRKKMTYTGEQLHSHWAYRNFGIAGDSIVAFSGPCDVELADMLDIEDVRSNSPIFSRNMLHFIIEHFGIDLEKAILRQRLLTVIVAECINKTARKQKPVIQRRGDDLFSGKRKLSVSIATITPVSAMIHFGININAKGAPVPAIGLEDLGVKAEPLARTLIKAYIDELKDIEFARAKVRPAP